MYIMEREQNTYLKADNNTIINEKFIRWVKKMDECMKVCLKMDGCNKMNTISVCKINNPDSYERLNALFK